MFLTGTHTMKTGTGPPPEGTPEDFWDMWLRYHEAELCQGLDTVFVFHEKSVEIWCRVEEERAYVKFADLIAPLRAAHKVDVYLTRLSQGKKQSDDKEPPPSLWNNEELRTYLQDPLHRGAGISPAGPDLPERGGITPPGRENAAVSAFKQRMIMFADQTLDWSRRMKRSAGDLPALVEAAFRPEVSRKNRSRARTTCLAHAQTVDRYAQRLADNLSDALPKAAKKDPGLTKKERRGTTAATTVDLAFEVAESAQNLSRRIYLFIYPIHYTVGLSDLREPSLLESLSVLRKDVSTLRRMTDRE